MTTANRTTEPPRIHGDDPRTDRRAGFGWRRLQALAAWGAIASLVVPMVMERSVEGFFVAMIAPFVIGLLLLLRWRRVGAVWLGVVSLAELLSSAPFLAEALIHPESLADFLPLVAFTLSTLVGSIAAIPAFRQGVRPDTPSRSAMATAALAALVLAAATTVSVIAASGVDSVQAQAGDIPLTAKDFQFGPSRITASRGTVAVVVTNDDTTRHTFTIDGLDVDLNLPPNSTQRVTFAADAGTYRFICTPHAPDMAGDLVVE
jgi:plastocyanin